MPAQMYGFPEQYCLIYSVGDMYHPATRGQGQSDCQWGYTNYILKAQELAKSTDGVWPRSGTLSRTSSCNSGRGTPNSRNGSTVNDSQILVHRVESLRGSAHQNMAGNPGWPQNALYRTDSSRSMYEGMVPNVSRTDSNRSQSDPNGWNQAWLDRSDSLRLGLNSQDGRQRNSTRNCKKRSKKRMKSQQASVSDESNGSTSPGDSDKDSQGSRGSGHPVPQPRARSPFKTPFECRDPAPGPRLHVGCSQGSSNLRPITEAEEEEVSTLERNRQSQTKAKKCQQARVNADQIPPKPKPRYKRKSSSSTDDGETQEKEKEVTKQRQGDQQYGNIRPLMVNMGNM